MRRQYFLLQPADRQYPSANRDLTGHREVTADWNVCQRTTDTRCNRNASRGSVLRNGALRNMHVNIQVPVEVALQAQKMRSRPDVAHRGMRRLLHYITQLACSL